jgi:hypothetical protein
MALTDIFGQVNVIGGTVPTAIMAAAGNRDVMQVYIPALQRSTWVARP